MIGNNSKKTIVLYITVLPLNEKFVFGISKDNENFYHNPPLILNPLTNYEFIIQSPGHPFYITTNKQGGTKTLDGAITIKSMNRYRSSNSGIENGILSWSPSAAHSKMKLYYQCDLHKNMGNEIIFKKKKF